MVVQVVEAGRQHLRRDGAELHGLARLTLGHLPNAGICQRTAGKLVHHIGQYARLKYLEHDIASRLVAARGGATTPQVMPLHADQALGGISEPGATADITVTARVAVGEKIEASSRLIGKMRGRRGYQQTNAGAAAIR